MHERRRHERYPADLIVMYELVANGLQTGMHLKSDTPVVEDISKSGIKIITSQLLPEGSCLKLLISSLFSAEYIEALGKVAWSRTCSENINSIGIEFLELDNSSSEILERFLKAISSQSHNPDPHLL